MYGSSIFLYVRPLWGESLLLSKVADTLSCIVTPLLNPFIFSLRNDKVKEVLQDVFRQNKVKFSQMVRETPLGKPGTRVDV